MGCPDFMVAYIFRRVLESNYTKFSPDRLKKSVIKSILYVILGPRLRIYKISETSVA